MKCDICKANIKETFLKKILGRYIKDEKGKKHAICSSCQTRFPDKKTALSHLK